MGNVNLIAIKGRKLRLVKIYLPKLMGFCPV
jgi:hypothetical protein